MKIPDDKIDEISQKVDILEIVGEYVQLKRRGNRYWGLSPFKSEKTPSFTVSPDKGLFYCFSTNKGGTVFTFVMEMENLSFPEAVEFLAEKTGVELNAADHSEGGDLRAALKELYERVSGSFRYIFEHSDKAQAARDYMSRRGVSRPILGAFGVGYAPADRRWLYRFLKRRSYSDEFLEMSGLFSQNRKGSALFADRVMFPIHSRRGDVVAFGGRALSDFGPKYINSPEHPLYRKREHLFGLDLALPAIRKQGVFHLVEGYMDVIACHQAGEITAVAPLGTSFTPEQAKLLSRYAQKAVLVFDPDDAGRSAAFRAAPILAQHELEGFVVTLPEGQDPADILVARGGEAVSSAFREEIELLPFLISAARSRHDAPDLVLRELFPYITSVSSAVRRESCLEQVADTLGVDKFAVQKDYERGGKPPAPSRSRVDEVRTFPNSIDLFLMLATLVNREHFSFVRNTLRLDELEDENARSLYIALEESYRRSADSIQSVLARLDDEPLRHEVFSRITSEEFTQNADRLIKDAVYRIKERSIAGRQNQIDARLRRLRSSSADTRSEERELLEEKMFLNGELQKLKG